MQQNIELRSPNREEEKEENPTFAVAEEGFGVVFFSWNIGFPYLELRLNGIRQKRSAIRHNGNILIAPFLISS